MDLNPRAAGDADSPAPWADLAPGQDVGIREPGRPVGKSAANNVAPDAQVLWLRVDGHAPRPIYLGGNPAEIIPELEIPDAY